MSENAAPQTASRPSTLTLDTQRSSVSFKVKKLGFHTVKGRFAGEPTVQLTRRTDLLDASGTIRVADVTTGIARRDKHLLSSDFFDAATYPELAIAAVDIPLTGIDTPVQARVTIKGTTRPVEMVVLARKRAGGDIEVHATGELNRRDFGIIPPRPVDRYLVAACIEITIELYVT